MTATGAGPRRKQDIFRATLEMLAENGYERLTIEGIAELSGVNKTTIYRWWPSKAALTGDALVEARVLDFQAPDTGSLRGDLKGLVDGMAALLTTPPAAEIAVAALGAAVNSPELTVATRRFFAERFARELPIFDRAANRGELRPGTDPMTIVDLLAGAVWLRAVFRGMPLEDGFADRAVDLVLDGARLRH
ncbi:TetR/AcrR family transcriptional regulator [Sphaerisporangium fuscum]|uniref:TetR/AcrR family transcriptional regulator n=1 Tax=Sphaerisporangium fuscum TaxID=2835868 RepID=UPI001BDBDC71|nr:TetR/AcrR family transcriptional regulator [Sphaerisporangium fuscum]